MLFGPSTICRRHLLHLYTTMQKSRGSSPPSPRVPPAPKGNRSSKKRHGRSRDRGYSLPRSRSRKSEITLLLCVFHTTSHNWSREPYKFDPRRINDRELWTDIRNTFRMDLQKPWRRVFGFKKVKSIVPIGVRHLSEKLGYAMKMSVH